MEEKTKRPITITKKVYISPTWGDAPLKLIATKLGNSLYLTELINRSKCGVDWFSSSGEVQNLRFAIGTTSGPYHCSAAALARDSYSKKRFQKTIKYYPSHNCESQRTHQVSKKEDTFSLNINERTGEGFAVLVISRDCEVCSMGHGPKPRKLVSK